MDSDKDELKFIKNLDSTKNDKKDIRQLNVEIMSI